MRNFLLTIVFLCGLGLVRGQAQPEYVAGELLIQLSPKADVAQVVANLEGRLGRASELRLKRVVVEEMRIYLVSFNTAALPQAEALRLARNASGVQVVQNNHIIKQRRTPNDPLFSQQWQYINTGASGGAVNADLDIDLAWDITTGGVTPLGDTIVVCIVDDGLDLTHMDVAPNRWYNRQEIPNNGADDDGNGYVDDYDGWNAYDNTDDISGGSHGTSVAGIVGAKGDNGLGVAGVNWDIKLMIVNGGGDEAEALAAYAYPLRMRRLYNQTGGQHGAYVVATNSSWGTDNLMAADAPLWCAFYDSLGMAGIVSVGATANRNVDVDVVGDMPTSCGSPYLITVTNLRRTDIKEFSAGYGVTTIDLGAYGTDTYTTDYGNTYAAFGGTSGATPHVTGTVGLIFSAPCLRLATIAQAAPDVAALMVRDFILQGVTPNTSLQGITTTEGRLNTNNAVVLAMASGCAVTGCYTPFGLRASAVTGTGFTMSWATVGDAQGYLTRYRMQGDTTWITGAVADTFMQVSGLTACTVYEVQISSDCDTTFSDYSNSILVKTGDCCNAPTTITINATDSNTAYVSCNIDTFVQSYDIMYREVGSPRWSQISSANAVFQIAGLLPCTHYELEIMSVCPVNVNNTISNIVGFKTKGCGACEDNNYCESAGLDATYEWIRRVTVGTMTNSSNSNSGYADFTGMVIAPDLQAGDSVAFELVAGQNNSSPNWYWRVWLDYDQNGIFDETAELAYAANGLTQLTTAGFLQIPATARGGITRMRVAFKWGSLTPSPCATYNYGEIEDYCVNILSTVAVDKLTVGELVAYPNPFGSSVEVRLPDVELAGSRLVMYNALGQQVAGAILESGQRVQALETSDLASGAYFVVLELADGGRWACKLLSAGK